MGPKPRATPGPKPSTKPKAPRGRPRKILPAPPSPTTLDNPNPINPAPPSTPIPPAPPPPPPAAPAPPPPPAQLPTPVPPPPFNPPPSSRFTDFNPLPFTDPWPLHLPSLPPTHPYHLFTPYPPHLRHSLLSKPKTIAYITAFEAHHAARIELANLTNTYRSSQSYAPPALSEESRHLMPPPPVPASKLTGKKRGKGGRFEATKSSPQPESSPPPLPALQPKPQPQQQLPLLYTPQEYEQIRLICENQCRITREELAVAKRMWEEEEDRVRGVRDEVERLVAVEDWEADGKIPGAQAVRGRRGRGKRGGGRGGRVAKSVGRKVVKKVEKQLEERFQEEIMRQENFEKAEKGVQENVPQPVQEKVQDSAENKAVDAVQEKMQEKVQTRVEVAVPGNSATAENSQRQEATALTDKAWRGQAILQKWEMEIGLR